MKRQTSFYIGKRTDRLFNVLGAIFGFHNRGETASAALQFLNALQKCTNYPPEIKESINGVFSNVVGSVKKKYGRSDWNEPVSLFEEE